MRVQLLQECAAASFIILALFSLAMVRKQDILWYFFYAELYTAQQSYVVRNSVKCSFAVVSTLPWAMVGVSLPVHNLNTDTHWGAPCRKWEKLKFVISMVRFKWYLLLSSLIFVNLLVLEQYFFLLPSVCSSSWLPIIHKFHCLATYLLPHDH